MALAIMDDTPRPCSSATATRTRSLRPSSPCMGQKTGQAQCSSRSWKSYDGAGADRAPCANEVGVRPQHRPQGRSWSTRGLGALVRCHRAASTGPNSVSRSQMELVDALNELARQHEMARLHPAASISTSAARSPTSAASRTALKEAGTLSIRNWSMPARVATSSTSTSAADWAWTTTAPGLHFSIPAPITPSQEYANDVVYHLHAKSARTKTCRTPTIISEIGRARDDRLPFSMLVVNVLDVTSGFDEWQDTLEIPRRRSEDVVQPKSHDVY